MRHVLVVNPDEQMALFGGASEPEPEAAAAKPRAKPRAKPTKKRTKKGAPVAKKKTKKPKSKRAKQCRRAPQAPSTVECEPMKRNKKGQYVASGGRRQKKSRRRRRSNPEPAPSRRRRRRRRNPDLGNLAGGIMTSLRRVATEALPRIGAKLATSYVVKRWGNAWGPGIMGPDELGSEYSGKGWTLWNYILALGVAAIGAPIVNRWRAGYGRVWQDSIVDDLFGRLVYTEIIGRSKWAAGAFGSDLQPIGWEDDGRGNRFALMQGSAYQPAMLGLQEAGPLGGLQPATHLGALQEASALGGPRRRRGRMGNVPDPYATPDSPYHLSSVA